MIPELLLDPDAADVERVGVERVYGEDESSKHKRNFPLGLQASRTRLLEVARVVGKLLGLHTESNNHTNRVQGLLSVARTLAVGFESVGVAF